MTSSADNAEPLIISSMAELRDVLDTRRRSGQSIGFVPTMGYLHDGHASLMRTASAENDVVVVSIFVNPLQFGENEDLSSYPRDLESDIAVAGVNGVAILFVPDEKEMYPNGAVLTSVSVPQLSSLWDGVSRPGHFTGVATVVTKLFNIVAPSSAYFGLKDFQQISIIQQMVFDLSLPIRIVGCPIRREPDGLAMSSRNSYMTAAERAAATVLYRALKRGSELILEGERSPTRVDAAMRDLVEAEPLAEVEYAVAVNPVTLVQPERIGTESRLLIAARLGNTRLIDNCGVSTDPAAPKGAL